MPGFNYWHASPTPTSRRSAGPRRPSSYMPSFPKFEPGFWRAYGWQTAGALLAGVIGVLGWMFYARSLAVLGSGAFMYFTGFSLAVIAGIGLPIHYYRRHRMLRSFDIPETTAEGPAELES
jgi:hypothetical protein